MTANQARDIRIEETAQAGKYRKRRMDIAEKWLQKGTITSNQHAAAVNFAITFENAQMREHFTLSRWEKERVDGTRGNVERSSLNVINSRKRIEAARDLLGSSMFPVTADVIGSGLSLREHSFRTVNGKRITEHEARGRLIAALDLLDRHWV